MNCNRSIDRWIAGTPGTKKEECIAAGGSGCCLLSGGATAAGITEFKLGPPWGGRHCNWNWELATWQLAAGDGERAKCNVQPVQRATCVQHQLQLSLFLNGIIYTAVSQMPSAFSAMFTVVYFVVHRASHLAHFLNFHSHSPSHASHFSL